MPFLIKIRQKTETGRSDDDSLKAEFSMVTYEKIKCIEEFLSSRCLQNLINPS